MDKNTGKRAGLDIEAGNIPQRISDVLDKLMKTNGRKLLDRTLKVIEARDKQKTDPTTQPKVKNANGKAKVNASDKKATEKGFEMKY